MSRVSADLTPRAVDERESPGHGVSRDSSTERSGGAAVDPSRASPRARDSEAGHASGHT